MTDVKKAAEEYMTSEDPWYPIYKDGDFTGYPEQIDAFIAGAKWAKSRMSREDIESIVDRVIQEFVDQLNLYTDGSVKDVLCGYDEIVTSIEKLFQDHPQEENAPNKPGQANAGSDETGKN